jgi:hypothetical protein
MPMNTLFNRNDQGMYYKFIANFLLQCAVWLKNSKGIGNWALKMSFVKWKYQKRSCTCCRWHIPDATGNSGEQSKSRSNGCALPLASNSMVFPCNIHKSTPGQITFDMLSYLLQNDKLMRSNLLRKFHGIIKIDFFWSLEANGQLNLILLIPSCITWYTCFKLLFYTKKEISIDPDGWEFSALFSVWFLLENARIKNTF